MTRLIHLIQSIDPNTGGVIEAVNRLNEELLVRNIDSEITCQKHYQLGSKDLIIAHGLWQWPSYQAWKNLKRNGIPYIVYPHGMLDPWFKKSYRFKHLKKQIYWWWREGKILHDAYGVCFTTEEECKLARRTFSPYESNEFITGLGVADPPDNIDEQLKAFATSFPQIEKKRILLYLGRFHPKKGVDLLINSFLKQCKENDLLFLAGPIENSDQYTKQLQKLTNQNKTQIIWSGMLEGDLKWGALRIADALILPSHQENFGMVIAEALSVSTPVLLTNKVNLWREVEDLNAGFISNDDQDGINNLVQKWVLKKHLKCIKNASKCFREKLHISQTVEKIISILPKR